MTDVAKPTVAVLGGGIAGLTAAHELAERGYDVTIYEARKEFGGKARSYGKPGTGDGRRGDLPGEHGFRFFPGFYRHIPDTMKRIPFAGGSVFNNLVPAPMAMFARHGRKDAKFPTHAPRTLKEVIRALYTLFHTDLGLSFGEVRFFLRQLAYLATSCEERRITQVEKLDWTFWVDAKNPKWSDAYRMYCADGLTRLLVAAKADDISARTAGVTLLQLMLDMAPGAVGADRVLNGPTNDVWIDPWVTFLTEQRGVHHATGVTVRDIVIEGGSVARVDAERDGKPMTINAQYYVCALPGDVVGRMVTDNHDLADVGLGGVRKLVFEWMNGYQFYMKAPVKIVAGHTAYMESKWSLTSISQGQFWKQPIADTYGKGEVHDILSVDISDWEVEGSNGKCAKDCTEAELKEEVLRQIEDHVNDDEVKFDRGDIVDCHLDQSLIWRDGVWENLDPLLINKQGTWRHRPDAALPKIPNLFVAGDYVQTFTDLATMESANEGGRRAANAILMAEEREPDVMVLPLREPDELGGWKTRDRRRFEQSPDRLPWESRGIVETQYVTDINALVDEAIAEETL